jgi:hypothetical protein
MLARVFGSVRKEYLLRAYVIGLAFYGLFIFMDYQAGWPEGFFWKRAFPGLICAVLFPFSKLVYDELKRFVLGDNIFLFNALIMIIAKFFINLLLFMCAWFIAPVGVAYLWMRSR